MGTFVGHPEFERMHPGELSESRNKSAEECTRLRPVIEWAAVDYSALHTAKE
jgi:hypothetical protein